MISVDEALSQLFALAPLMAVEAADLRDAGGRVLAEPVAARRSQPPFPASAMDGYAVRTVDIASGTQLTVIGQAPAGARFQGSVGPGEAVRIFTGAPVPEGADRILIQEDATREGDVITVGEDLDTATYIRPAGGDFREGDTIPPGRMTPARLSLLAAMNVPVLPVRCRPQVALLSTGDELVTPGDVPGPDQIVSSNIYGVAEILRAQGASPRLLPIATDNETSLRSALDLASECDLLVTLGGASVGDHDIVAQVLGPGMSFNKVRMRPGKPLMAGLRDGQMIVGLPGNPVSALVCAHVFLRPLVDAMLGLPACPLPRHTARLTHDLRANGGREHYMRARVENGEITVFDRQDSSLLSVIAEANALAVRQPGEEASAAGAEIPFVPLSDQ